MKLVRTGLVSLGLLLGAILMGGQAGASPAPKDVSLMTYNVHGLPWPITSGRPAAIQGIVAQLRAMRAAGRQPNIVALQEAFVDDAKAIGRAAGYRYSAFGPDEDTALAGSDALDRAFVADGSRFVGERMGKHVDSGLAIFSDYPIVAVHRVAYAVCAGYDCLANKGALAATIAVPGVAAPVTVINTHLNSAAASGTAPSRSLYAYQRQLDTLTGFMGSLASRAGSKSGPMLVAGDFNVGRDPARRAYFSSHMLGVGGTLQAASVSCRSVPGCTIANPAGLGESFGRNKDWLMYRSSAVVGVRAVGMAAPFGRAADGSMLSDHIGVSALYRFGAPTAAPARAVALASR